MWAVEKLDGTCGGWGRARGAEKEKREKIKSDILVCVCCVVFIGVY